MNLHEFQAKSLFAHYGIAVPAGVVVRDSADINKVLEQLEGNAWIVKAQIHAGGRGKGGGVKSAEGQDGLQAVVKDLLGSRLVTHQTGPDGLPVETLLVETLTEIRQEFYLGLLVDRASRRVTIMASAAGGMDIETVAAETPEKILTEAVDPVTGLMPYQARKLGFTLGLDKGQVGEFAKMLAGLYKLFIEADASLVEVNPMILNGEGQVMALDGKINLDANALYRHPDLLALRDTGQEEKSEVIAQEHDLNYIKLDGAIGCMVNGAGLAMATMDLIKLQGGEPANFLDVGGGTTAERVAEAFKLILSDEKVRAVLVNIFGGIVRCDLIAEGIINAVREVGVQIPVVVRLEGTNVEQGRALLADSGLDIIAVSDLTEAATRAVKAAA